MTRLAMRPKHPIFDTNAPEKQHTSSTNAPAMRLACSANAPATRPTCSADAPGLRRQCGSGTAVGRRPCRALAALALLAAVSLAAVPPGTARAAEIADIAPADTLLYVEITRPAELWASLQKTEIRKAVRSSFAAELVLNFVAATAGVLCQSLTDRTLGQVVERYDPRIGLVFCPPDPAEPSDSPQPAVVIRASEHHEELQSLLRDRAGKTLTARFPRVTVAADRIGEHDVTNIAFSPKRIWTLAFPDQCVVYGRQRAVRRMLTSKAHLGGNAKYAQARKDISPPAGAHVFCYSETTQPAGIGAITCKTGSVMSAVLEIDTTVAGPALVRDRIILSGNVETPPPGPLQACRIGSVFPAGPWLVNQISFASPAEAATHLRIATHKNKAFEDALNGTGFVALAAAPDNLLDVIFAAEIVQAATARAALKSLGFNNEGNTWRKDDAIAIVKNGCVYVGRSAVMKPLLERLTAAEPKMIHEKPDYSERLAMLAGESHGYSVMTAEFLLGPGCFEEFKQFHEVLAKLSPSVAGARKTDKGIEVRSVSPCGYGIWLVTANLSATPGE